LQDPGQLSVLIADQPQQAIVFASEILCELLYQMLINSILTQVLDYLIHGDQKLCSLSDFIDDFFFNSHIVVLMRAE
jgi:hypothetical protein